ncbi:MAG: Hpt domain-containing protein [Acidobacteriota bacterium]
MNASVLDPKVLSSLEELGGRGLLAEMAAAALTQGEERMVALEGCRREGDILALGRVAHALRSSAAALGARRLEEACSTVEQATKRFAGEDLDAMVGELKAAYRQAEGAWRELVET